MILADPFSEGGKVGTNIQFCLDIYLQIIITFPCSLTRVLQKITF